MVRRAVALLAALAVGLVLPPAHAARPSPYVAYASNEGGTYDLHLVRLDGTGHQQLTSGPADETGPAWAPDGHRLAFWSRTAGTSDLAVIDLRTRAIRLLGVATKPDDQHHVFAPSWSPRGDWILLETNRYDDVGASGTELALVRPDGTGLRRLTSDHVLTAAPSWYPDGRSFVYSQQFGESSFPELYRQWLDGRRVRLTTDEAHDWEGRWSPDGRSLAFTSNRVGERFGIFVRRPDGRLVRVAASPAPATGMSPSWTPDGRSLVYCYDPDGSSEPSVGYFGGTDLRVYPPGLQRGELHVVSTDGKRDRVLLRGNGDLLSPAVQR